MNESSPRVIAFGEVLWDLLPDGKVLGGAPANFVYRLNDLGVPAALISRVGNDELGKEARDQLLERGFPTAFISEDPVHPTGTVEVRLSPSGDADYTIVPEVAYDYIELSQELLEVAAEAEMICFGTLVQRGETSRRALYQLLDACPKPHKLVDVNLRKDCYSAETIRESLERADILKLNCDELKTVAELLQLSADTEEATIARLVERFGLEIVLLTLGQDGVRAYAADMSPIEVPGFRVKVVDTVGSGDNFTAGFVYSLLEGNDLTESCRFGNLLGSLVAAKKGGMPELSDEDEGLLLSDE